MNLLDFKTQAQTLLRAYGVNTEDLNTIEKLKVALLEFNIIGFRLGKTHSPNNPHIIVVFGRGNA